MMNILITGAGGFLGLHLAEKLKKLGHNVINFSRSHHQGLDVLDIKTRQGNLTNIDDVMKAFEGIDTVFHVASKVGMWGNYKDFFDTNVIGSRNVILACKKYGIKQLIYTSTPSVVFGKEDLCGVDESIDYPKEFLSHYAQTKAEAEKEVLAANGYELSTCALRPHLIFGPNDPHLFPRVIDSAKKGRLKIVGDGQNLVDVAFVENVADAHILAMDKLLRLDPGVCGKAFFIAQEKPVKLWDFVNDILEANKIPRLTKKISAKSAFNIGLIFEKFYGLFGIKKEPAMTRFISLQLSKSHYFNHTNAKNKLGFIPKVPLKEAFEKSVRTNYVN